MADKIKFVVFSLGCKVNQYEGSAMIEKLKENGFDAFTSTLFISPYHNHELLISEAKAAAEKYGVEFLYRDFRPYFNEGQEKAREEGLYMQKHCGCIFSEEDKYKKKK